MQYDTIGKNIKIQRIAKHLRQGDLAAKTALSTNYIGMIERGEKIASLESFIAILNALDASADIILAGVMNKGYTVKNSQLDEKLSVLAPDDRETIYDVVDTLIAHSKKH